MMTSSMSDIEPNDAVAEPVVNDAASSTRRTLSALSPGSGTPN